MPRIARLVVTGVPHHVTQRGNYKQAVFSCNDDYCRYLKWLKEYHEKHHLSVLAYCLMPNHVHVIAVPQKQDSLAKTFNTCHMRYSQYFNRKQRLTGHLWQGRFYSCPLDEGHLYEAIRYIENNPVRAKLAKDAAGWLFSSARCHLGYDKSVIPLADIKEYLAIEKWSAYLKEKSEQVTIEKIRANTLTGRPSGSDSFVTGLEKRFGIRLRPLPEGRPKGKDAKIRGAKIRDAQREVNN